MRQLPEMFKASFELSATAAISPRDQRGVYGSLLDREQDRSFQCDPPKSQLSE
jgi:hypothetical protein